MSVSLLMEANITNLQMGMIFFLLLLFSIFTEAIYAQIFEGSSSSRLCD